MAVSYRHASIDAAITRTASVVAGFSARLVTRRLDLCPNPAFNRTRPGGRSFTERLGARRLTLR